MFREIELKGSLGCGLQDYPNLLNFISVTKFDVKALVTHTFSLSDIKKGFTLLEKGDESLIRAIAIP
jgi:threonine dehydrogenase-like Zn-dependent dehydrogenase